MAEEVSFFSIVRVVFLWFCPLIFVEGLLLLLLSRDEYTKFEHMLGKEIGGIRRKLIARLEDNIDTFHAVLLQYKNTVGALAIISSLLFFTFLTR